MSVHPSNNMFGFSFLMICYPATGPLGAGVGGGLCEQIVYLTLFKFDSALNLKHQVRTMYMFIYRH